MSRNRITYCIFILLVILLGLASRHYSNYLPRFMANYSGDTLWGLMIFFCFGFIFRDKSIKFVFFCAVIVSFLVETSQLYQANWINSIRSTFLGGLILGFGFLWSDLVCYFVGISVGTLLEYYHYKA
ncbi:DUF2809 domain-containing protein [Clostridium aestuarii]|uniref:DUF2809 domain-containing protein n=1 Tax=Clostridium aestuarii TaxID=338193 RepID=A0ABT4D0F4_9CLOT|nr:DUF2809 domain-containing protein [Clostridium aestuarii]MCY6484724.1 DUF2809 domain-containing protein [Clostridium aestuarii]